MRLLRLGNSYETDANIAADDNKVAVSERLLGQALGEDVETTSRVIWPGPELPELIDRWLDRYDPDIALLIVSSYWFTNVSLPLQLERRFGRVGKAVARRGELLVRNPRLARNPVFERARQSARKRLGGATHFTPEYINELMETCIRRILLREQVALVVRGPRLAFAFEDTPKSKRLAEERRQIVHRRLRELCAQLHIEYIGYESAQAPQDARSEFQDDLVHATTAVHAEQGEIEAEALIAAWRSQHPA
ncbi:MAG: hypothetical protein ABI577_12060 [bacterium]